MVQNIGNATAHIGGTGHRPLPLAQGSVYSAAHVVRDPKRGGFDWDWNKKPCTVCGNQTAKPDLLDQVCAACRRVLAAPEPTTAPAPKPQPSPSRPRATSTKPRTAKLKTPKATPGPYQPRDGLDERKIISEYLAGDSPPAIAARYSIGPTRVRRLLDRHGVPRRDDRATNSGGAKKEQDPAFIADVVRLYVDEQLTQREVADRLGSTPKVVWRVLANHPDVQTRPGASELSQAGVGHPQKIQPTEYDQIVARYLAGESGPAIARSYDVASPSIYAILRKLNVPLRTRGTRIGRSTNPTGVTTA